MDLEKEQNIKAKLESIKIEADETSEIKIRKLKSLINQMNLHLFDNPHEKIKIFSLQKLGYEAILFVLDHDKETNENQVQKDKIKDLIKIIESEIESLS